MKRFFLTLAALTTLLVAWHAAAGDVPTVMTSQGVLRNAAGDVVNGVYSLKFKLYDAEENGQILWSELQNNVSVENGIYTTILGKISPVPGSLFANNTDVWLGISVEGEQELPRIRVTSVAYAFQSRTALVAEKAEDLECTGCIDEEALGFEPVAADDVVQMVKDSGEFLGTSGGTVNGGLDVTGVVTAAAFVGDGSGLTGISSPSGSCAKNWYVIGIQEDGTLICNEAPSATTVDGLTGGTIDGDVEVAGTLTTDGVEVCTEAGNCGDTLAQLACNAEQVAMWNGDMWTCSDFVEVFDPDALPSDGLDEISNDLLHNQFIDTYASPTAPVPVADNNPTGTDDEIIIPDAGTAQDLTVSINITNSDLSEVKVVLYDPNNVEYVLYDKGGPGQELGATYPNPVEPVSGDLTTWVGKNPQGKWRLLVIDTGFLNNATDGQINAWSIQVKTLSSKKIHLQGDLYIDGDIITKGGLTFDGEAIVKGSLKLGDSGKSCDPDRKGFMRYNGGSVQWCDGADWTALVKGSTYRWAVWSSYNQPQGWFTDNRPELFGGKHPSEWGDGNAMAHQMSSDTKVLRTLFVRKGPAIGTLTNATIWADEWRSYSSTNSKHVGVLFRIRNTTQQNITWTIKWYRTSYGGWAERASVTVNGANIWQSGGSNYYASDEQTINLTIPANRTSTAIFISGSTPTSGDMRTCLMAFYDNCLVLPDGLVFVDDLDTKPNGWDK